MRTIVGSGTLIRVGGATSAYTAYHVGHNVTPKLIFPPDQSNWGSNYTSREQVHRFEIRWDWRNTLIDMAKNQR